MIEIQQGCVPGYRVGFFDRVDRLRNVRVSAGDNYFATSVKTSCSVGAWFFRVENLYFLRRRLAIQIGAVSNWMIAPVFVCELNARYLSTLMVLAFRKVLGRPSIVWGHFAGGRSSGTLRYSLPRRLLVFLSSGVASYTRSDADAFRSAGLLKPVVALGNACLGAADIVRGGDYDGSRSIVYVGRLVDEKKVAVLVEAYARTLMLGVDIGRLEIVGEGPAKDSLMQMVRETGVQDRVDFHGHLNVGEDLRRVYRRSLFATSPGYVGLSAIQAMAHGVPIIVSNGEPHSPEIEACMDGKTAVFASDSTSGSWEATLLECFAADKTWIERRPAIAEFALQNYTFESMAENFVRLLEMVEKGTRG